MGGDRAVHALGWGRGEREPAAGGSARPRADPRDHARLYGDAAWVETYLDPMTYGRRGGRVAHTWRTLIAVLAAKLGLVRAATWAATWDAIEQERAAGQQMAAQSAARPALIVLTAKALEHEQWLGSKPA